MTERVFILSELRSGPRVWFVTSPSTRVCVLGWSTMGLGPTPEVRLTDAATPRRNETVCHGDEEIGVAYSRAMLKHALGREPTEEDWARVRGQKL